jgi:hypothetical protein
VKKLFFTSGVKKCPTFLRVSWREKYIDICLSTLLLLYIFKGFLKYNELENLPKVPEISSHVHGLGNLTINECMLVNTPTQSYDEENRIVSRLAIPGMQKLVRPVTVNEPF